LPDLYIVNLAMYIVLLILALWYYKVSKPLDYDKV